jgi:hypothetical protein
MEASRNVDIPRLLRSVKEDTSGIRPHGKDRDHLKQILKRYKSEIDNIDTLRAKKRRAVNLPRHENFVRVHIPSWIKSSQAARCPNFFAEVEKQFANVDGGRQMMSIKTKFNRLALLTLAKALETTIINNKHNNSNNTNKNKKNSNNTNKNKKNTNNTNKNNSNNHGSEQNEKGIISVIGTNGSNGIILLLKGSSRFCAKVMRIVREAGLDDPVAKAKDEVIHLDVATNSNGMVLKLEHIPDVDTAEIAFKENEVHRQLCEHVENVPVSRVGLRRYRHVFDGSKVFPEFVLGSTLVLRKLTNKQNEKNDNKQNKKNDKKQNNKKEDYQRDDDTNGGDIHYRSTFMSHVDNAVTLWDYLNADRRRLDARLFVMIEHAVLTMWFAGYAHCDFHAFNILIVQNIMENEQKDKKPDEKSIIKNGEKESINMIRPVVIDFGLCIKLESNHLHMLKLWWAEGWKNPDVVGEYQTIPEQVNNYATQRMWAKDFKYFNWEGKFLMCMAQILKGEDIVRERASFYEERTVTTFF